ncbi:MAG TPA: hypothetical protein PKE30_13180, partial [Niabella sp.]|nr:hypothetical protein [Niabella sp.]
MKKILVLVFITGALSCNEGAINESKESKAAAVPGNISLDNKKITVYTTADSTDLRLSTSDTASFTAMGQPLESQVCVFVDPDKTFQTFVGIGAALTDASAETFYKLPEEVRQEFLTAHFDKEKGIGYTIGRTNINSCDFSSDTYTYVK